MSDEESLELDEKSIKILQEVRKKLDEGEEVDPVTKEAMDSINFASQVVNSIMAGKQIDLAYLRIYTQTITNKINALSNVKPIERLGKRKRRKREEG